MDIAAIAYGMVLLYVLFFRRIGATYPGTHSLMMKQKGGNSIENVMQIPLKNPKRVETYKKNIMGMKVAEIRMIPEVGREYQLNVQRNLKGFEEQSGNIRRAFEDFKPLFI